jgi:chromosome segregation ATPase
MSAQNPLEPRVRSLEQIAQTLTTLLVRVDERMDQHEAWINQLGETHARVENNLAALTEIVVDLGRAQTRTEGAQERVENNLVALTEIVADLGRAQTQTEGAVVRLLEAQAHTDQRLDALINIVHGGRDENS